MPSSTGYHQEKPILAVHPHHGLPVLTLLLLTALSLSDSATFKLEIARTPDELARGLQGHAPLAADEGMYFILGKPQRASFWMKDVTYPIDIIFIDGEGVVDHVAHSVPPCEETPCPVYRSRSDVTNVLEVAAGTARRLQIEPGTHIGVDVEKKRARLNPRSRER